MVLTFLSDYGLDDDFVGVCHAVMAGGAPGVRVIDLTHAIPRQDVRRGAQVLRRGLPFAPAGVHVAVVDPGVGSARRAVAIRVAEAGRVLVGPDNGLLWPAAQRFGGAVEAIDIGASRHCLQPVSATFHGRDVFAPVAAALAAGAPFADAGAPLDVGELVALELARGRVAAGRIEAHAVGIDHFGNVGLDLERLGADGPALGTELRVNGEPAVRARTFADVAPGGLLLYVSSYDTPTLGVNLGSAAERLRLGDGDAVTVTWAT
jgi:S-adenosylmethionine hydrolase